MPHQCTACGRGFPDGSRRMLSGCPDCGGTTFQFVPNRGDDVDGGRIIGGSDGSEDGAAGPPSVDDGSRGEDVHSPDGVDASPPDGVDASPPDGVDASPPDGVDASPPDGVDASPPDGITTDEGVLVDGEGIEDDAQAAARGSLPGADRLFGEHSGEAGVDARDHAAENEGAATDAAGPPTPDAAADGGSSAVAGGGEHAPAATPAGGADRSGPSTVEDLDAEAVAAELDSQFESIRIVEPGRYVINPVELFERDEQVIAVRENGRYVIDVGGSELEE